MLTVRGMLSATINIFIISCLITEHATHADELRSGDVSDESTDPFDDMYEETFDGITDLEDEQMGNELPYISTECLPSAMAKCTDPLRVVTDNKDLGFAATASELQEVCPNLLQGLQCIDDFTLKCLDNEHRNYFDTLYQGTTRVIFDLCSTSGQYQSEYLKHAPCMREVQPTYASCADEYQAQIEWLNHRESQTASELDYQEETNVKILCCSFARYIQCSTSIVNTTCGHETAIFAQHFLDRMSGPLIQGHCAAFADAKDSVCPHPSSLRKSDWPSNFLPNSDLDVTVSTYDGMASRGEVGSVSALTLLMSCLTLFGLMSVI